MLQLLKRLASNVGAASPNRVRLFVDSADGLFKTKDEAGNLSVIGGVQTVNTRAGTVTVNAFGVVTGNTGTANADADDSLSITGVNGISTTASDNPETLVITPAYGSPVGLAPDGANAAGAANTFARSDHVHATPTDTAVGLSGGSASGEGTSASFSRADHTHAIANGGTPSTITPDTAANQGSSTSLARSDHVHALLTDAAITLNGQTTSSEGVSTSFSRADHSHAINNGGTPSILNANAVGSQGGSASLARSDHVHEVPTASAVAISNATTNTVGTSPSFARADHTHAIANLRSTRATEFVSVANNATVQAVQSLVIPAARITAGFSVMFQLSGTQTNAATSGGNNNVILQVNGTTIATATVAVGATAQTNRAFFASGGVTFRSTTQVVGAATHAISGVLQVSATNAAAPTTIAAGDATITIAVQTTTANAGNTIRVGAIFIAEV